LRVPDFPKSDQRSVSERIKGVEGVELLAYRENAHLSRP
jgi:hypothetical protein